MSTQVKRASRVVVAIATAGRRDQMRLTMQRLAKLDPLPSRIVIAPATPEDFDEVQGRLTFPGVQIDVVTPRAKGLTVQRNAILDHLHSSAEEFLIFLDDDFYPCSDYALKLADLFDKYSNAVAFTGRPQLDGAAGPGVPHDAASIAVDRMNAATTPAIEKPTYGAYGCNMSIRLSPVRAQHLRFDEELPLYSWLEDIEFSRRLARFGTILESTSLRGVHLGVKSGRVSGVRFGYSQVANPVYCVLKRSMTPQYALHHVTKNMVMNVARLLWPEPWVDRRGRLWGNLLAIRDLLIGRSHPLRILEL
jgi:hypothetical protein